MANFFGDDGTLDKATDKIGLDFDNDRGRSNAGSNSSGGSSNSGGGTSRAPSTSPAPPKRPSGNSGSNSGGYTSLADRYDGGGPGVSGGPHKGGGIISDIGNFISSAAGGYDNVRDMGDGGGPGESDPDEFGGTLGKISNALGYKPVDGDPDTRDIGGRIGSLVGGAVAGLPGALVGRMIGSGKINLGMDSSQGPGKIDAEIEAIANDDSLSDGQKQAKANKVVAEAVEETVDEAEAENAAQGVERVSAMADQVYGTQGKGQGNPNGPNSILNDPQAFLTGINANLSSRTPSMDANASGTVMSDISTPPTSQYNYTPATATPAGDVAAPGEKPASVYNAAMSTGRVTNIGQADAQQGQVRDEAVIDPAQGDIQGTATGRNEDGTVNEVGLALNDAQTQNISTVIDTSTVSGKLLAQELGEGSYTDAKATVQGQLEILSKQFTDPNTGEPKIPSWAAGVARNVSRVAAFKGMTGTAATAAMSQAIMEASLPIAQQDAKFFQTATMQNLDNRQQMAVQKAQVLSNLQLANLDARMTAAVNNSKSFLQMDLANLDNAQQAEIVNTQARVQSILEDSKAENAARLFRAESQNDFTKFYDQLDSQIDMFNNEQRNAMARFNTGSEFNAQLENQREQFYRDMQYQVDLANARWRQTVETANTEMEFQAAQQDVQNLLQISSESLNRVWDRADSVLDYAWRSSETEKEREQRLIEAEMDLEAAKYGADQSREAAEAQGRGAIIGGALGMFREPLVDYVGSII
jgi:hypothetical protein